MPPYFNLNQKIQTQNNNQFCSTPTKFNKKQKQIQYKIKTNSIQNKNNPIGCGTAPGNLIADIFQK